MRKRATSQRTENRSIQRLLFDDEEAAESLSLTPDAIDRLVELGLLIPSVVVGFRRLFSQRDLERFADTPRRINLNGPNQELLAGNG